MTHGPALDLADDRHLLDLVRLVAGAPLVEERQVGVEVLAELLGGLDAAGVGRDHDQVVAGKPELVLEVGRDQRQRREVVERHVEVALDLAGVQVDRHDPVGAGDATAGRRPASR